MGDMWIFLATLFVVISLTEFGRTSCMGQAVILQHSGNANPLSEGWQPIGINFPGVESGPINDAGTPAWYVDDNGFTYLYYRGYVSGSQAESALLKGWSLKLNIRVVDIPDSTPHGSPVVGYTTIGQHFGMGFGTQPDGDPIVFLPTSISSPLSGQTFAVDGAGPGYHTYEMVFDPSSASVNLFVDGIERFSNYAGLPSSSETHHVSWGTSSVSDMGQGNFNLVRFAIIPEPSTIAQFGLMLFLMIARRNRRKL